MIPICQLQVYMYQPSAYHTLYWCPPTFNWQATEPHSEPHSTVMWLNWSRWCYSELLVASWYIISRLKQRKKMAAALLALCTCCLGLWEISSSTSWNIPRCELSSELPLTLDQLSSYINWGSYNLCCTRNHATTNSYVLQSSHKSQRWMFAVMGVLLCEVGSSRFPNPDDYSNMLKQVQPSLLDLILSCTWYDPDEWPTIAKVHTRLFH